VNTLNEITQAEPTATDLLIQRMSAALKARIERLDPKHETALRLFNGFYEGSPEITIDLYGRTLVIHNYANPADSATTLISSVAEFYQEALYWITSVLVKSRYGKTIEEKRGVILDGDVPDRFIKENGVWYAVNLQLNQDASFYLDTRLLREWAKANMSGKSVLNTFAYTGSLGVAAKAGGASRVMQIDLKRSFLNVAKDSYTRNGFKQEKADFVSSDFWPQISHLKQTGARFDAVFVDPPIFSKTKHGTVDMAESCERVINKVRPLINDGGYLVAVNNSLFLEGAQYMATIEKLCSDGYLSIDRVIPVPQDFIGFDVGEKSPLPADPTPFNHPTKIVVLNVRRKDANSKVATELPDDTEVD
jgi:23S rRNA (cytosine1962-C5)-methyltransferase